MLRYWMIETIVHRGEVSPKTSATHKNGSSKLALLMVSYLLA